MEILNPSSSKKLKELDGFIVVTEEGSGLGFAKMLVDESREVTFAIQPEEPEEDENPEETEKNLEFLECLGQGMAEVKPLEEVLKDKNKYKNWGWLFDGNHNSEDADKLRKEGFLVWGTYSLTDTMEHDRKFAEELVKKAGLQAPPTFEFQDIESGIRFMEENPETAYIFKPDEDGKGGWATTAPDSDDNDEANDEIRRYLESMVEAKSPYILQERKKGVEINVEVFVHEGTAYFAHANFESKKKYSKDQGVFSGCSFDIEFLIPLNSKIVEDTVLKLLELPELKNYSGPLDMNLIVADREYWFLEFCFDDKTEVLTKDGWRLIKDVPIGTEVATLNRNTHELEYQKTTDSIAQDYAGEMVTLGNGSIDAVMTPNHRQYVKKLKHFKQRESGISYSWQDVEAKDLRSGMIVKRDATWEGSESGIYVIPEYIERHYNGKHKFYFDIKHPAKTVAMDDWLRFLAYYLSEGSNDGYSVNISQENYNDIFEETLKKLPFKYRNEGKKGFRISSIQLVHHLKEFGSCYEKYVPNYVKELSPQQIRVFLDAYCLGDGTRHKRTGQISYFTTSPKMADDLQELILKAGSFANIKTNKVKGTKMSVGGGKTYMRKHDVFSLSERKERNELWLTKKHIGRKQYNGKVYCVTVPNHTIYVRRNGKAMWSSNCCRLGYNSHPNLFINLAISPFGKILDDIFLGRTENFDRHFRNGFGAAITMRVDNPTRGFPIDIPPKLDRKFYHFNSYRDNGRYYMAGNSEEIGIICGHDYDTKSAAEEALKNFDKIHFPGRWGRMDIDRDDYISNPHERYKAAEAMRLFNKKDETQ